VQLTYDLRYNVAYLRLREPATGVETRQVDDLLNIDIAPDGTLYGIEFLDARSQLFSNGGWLEVIDAALGESAKMEFPAPLPR
jgi:uncharacterized protein YuzE